MHQHPRHNTMSHLAVLDRYAAIKANSCTSVSTGFEHSLLGLGVRAGLIRVREQIDKILEAHKKKITKLKSPSQKL